MRNASAASAKGYREHTQLRPREGTKLRALYDLLVANKGYPVTVSKANKYRLVQLRDFYGLDIIHISGRGRGHPPIRWLLAGEWFGRTYVDYIADRINKETSE